MARILIGWEFGANRGHVVRMMQLARTFRDAGHEIIFALQQIDALTPEEAPGIALWQAPLTPRLLTNTGRGTSGIPATLGDILARLGVDDSRTVAAIVTAWRQMFQALRPDLVISEYAPLMLLAARGRIPTMSAGTGFQTPPPEMARFPPLVDRPPLVDEAATLAALNKALAAADAEPLAALPQLFAADRIIPDTFSELDPYAEWRRERPALPLPLGFGAAAGGGEEIFVYAPEAIAADAPFWRGLAEARLPMRVHVPRAAPALRAMLEKLGLIYEPEPWPISRIAERSRLLVSHGGHGFVCAGLAAGLPHVVCYFDVEKHFYGNALARHGLGGHVAMASIDPKVFGPSLKSVYEDDALAERARAAAPGFLARGQKPLEQAFAEAAHELL